jgi:general secretion pathway protein E
LIGQLNIAERRLPQDGRTDLKLGRAHLDIRISTIPALHGESIVLRLLRKDNVDYSLENIGMPLGIRTRFTELINLPHGMILVVGPTGSGKTTTLYCALMMLNSVENKIITVEDPIEYQVRGVTQMQVKPAIGLTFASGLRHIVRQDPDIILVGEIRDRETADIAMHAALTGHLVLSTLHTNDAVGAINRLVDMEDFLLSSALVGVVSQRLVRKLCVECAGTGQREDRNCRVCSGSGFKGRVGIYELLVVNEELRKAIRESADSSLMNAIARRHGMRSLREDGDHKIENGITTLAEVARVCQLDQ